MTWKVLPFLKFAPVNFGIFYLFWLLYTVSISGLEKRCLFGPLKHWSHTFQFELILKLFVDLIFLKQGVGRLKVKVLFKLHGAVPAQIHSAPAAVSSSTAAAVGRRTTWETTGKPRSDNARGRKHFVQPHVVFNANDVEVTSSLSWGCVHPHIARLISV